MAEKSEFSYSNAFIGCHYHPKEFNYFCQGCLIATVGKLCHMLDEQTLQKKDVTVKQIDSQKCATCKHVSGRHRWLGECFTKSCTCSKFVRKE